MRALQGRRIAVVSGDGLVARSEYGLLVVHGHPDAIADLLTDRSPDTAAGLDGLRRATTDKLPDGIAGIVVVTADDDELVITAAGPEHIDVDGVEPTAERDGDARISRVAADADVRIGLAAGWVSAAYDLRDGRVPGAGVALLATRPPAAADDAPAADPVPADDAAPAAGPVPADDDVPEVQDTRTLTAAYDVTIRAGKRLSDAPGPPGAPKETAQLQTGATRTVAVKVGEDHSQVTQPHDVEPGASPAVAGFMVFDDGITVTIDRPYVIGRQPPHGDDTPLVVDDEQHSVSRIHARIHPDDGGVLISDAGSSNGTHLWDAAASSWHRLPPGTPTVLPPDTYVALGKRVFIYVTEAPGQPIG